MKPRQVTFLLMIVLGTVLAPLVAEAQAPTKVARIGWMSRGGPTAKDANMSATLSAVVRGLPETLI